MIIRLAAKSNCLSIHFIPHHHKADPMVAPFLPFWIFCDPRVVNEAFVQFHQAPTHGTGNPKVVAEQKVG